MSHSSPALVVGRHASTRRRDRSVWSTTAPVSPVAVTAGTTPATRVPRSNATPHAAPVRPGLTPETERGGPSTATARVVRVDDGRRRPVEDNVIQRGAARCRLRRFAALLPGSDVRRRPTATLNVTARKVPVILGGRSLATGPIARHRDDTGDALPRLPPLPAPPRRNPSTTLHPRRIRGPGEETPPPGRKRQYGGSSSRARGEQFGRLQSEASQETQGRSYQVSQL